MKYRKKPVVIDAWQFTKENYRDGAPHFIKHAVGSPVVLWSQFGGEVIGGEIKTLEGVMTVSEGDFIIKGVQGEFYPCKPDIFAETYEESEPYGAQHDRMRADFQQAWDNPKLKLADIPQKLKMIND